MHAAVRNDVQPELSRKARLAMSPVNEVASFPVRYCDREVNRLNHSFAEPGISNLPE